jgi:hypothetical protein
MNAPTHTLAEQMAELERQIVVNRAVYPLDVRDGHVTQGQADYRLGAMSAALETLRGLVGAA